MLLNECKYVIISPVRNEESNIQMTIESVLSQTIKPMKWIIVDDGSTDTTPKIVEEVSHNVQWITLVKLPNRGYYDLMYGGEIKAFYIGYNRIKHMEWDFLCKLDGDISFNRYYFEDLLREFSINEKLGIASGACYNIVNKSHVLEKTYFRHVRGAGRIYRKKCWDDINGVLRELAWDAIDIYKARMLCWDTYTFEKIKMIHYVKTGTKAGIIHGRIRKARTDYLMGSHPLFLFIKALRDIFKRPYVVGFIVYSWGYLKCYIKLEKRLVDANLMAYIRKEQLSRLALFLKHPTSEERKHKIISN